MDNMEAVAAALMERFGQHIPSLTSNPVQYKCERCKDSGWIEIDPETRTVRKCSCRLAREAEERMRNSGLAEALDTQTLDSFQIRTEVQRKIKETAERYLSDLLGNLKSPRRPWLYIGGNPGSGKTHICTAVCGELLKNNIGVRYMQWLDVSRKLKAVVNDEDFEDEVSDYINVSVLYIDDLLKQKYSPNPVFSEADIKIAFTILNARYIQNKPTIISSEWDLVNQLLPADEGVFSRVYERSRGHRLTIERKLENNFRLAV